MTTEFINSLTPINRDDIQTQVVEDFLTFVKGIENPHATSLGYTEDGSVRMYYYRMGDGVLEIQVWLDDNDEYDRTVTDFITDPVVVQEMIGDELMTESSKQALERKLNGQLVPGQRLSGIITNVRDDLGIFVQVRPAMVGLAHVDNLPPGYDAPTKFFGVGDKIDVRVLRFNKRNNRLALTVVGPDDKTS